MPLTKKYVQKFRKSWLDRDELREWLIENPNSESDTKYGGYCIYCNTALPSKLYDLQSHAASRKHAKNVTDKTCIEIRDDETVRDIIRTSHSYCKLNITKPSDPHEISNLEQLCNTGVVQESKEDIFGRYVASELKLIKNKKIYEEVKWDILQVLQNAVVTQLDQDKSEA